MEHAECGRAAMRKIIGNEGSYVGWRWRWHWHWQGAPRVPSHCPAIHSNSNSRFIEMEMEMEMEIKIEMEMASGETFRQTITSER